MQPKVRVLMSPGAHWDLNGNGKGVVAEREVLRLVRASGTCDVLWASLRLTICSIVVVATVALFLFIYMCVVRLEVRELWNRTRWKDGLKNKFVMIEKKAGTEESNFGTEEEVLRGDIYSRTS